MKDKIISEKDFIKSMKQIITVSMECTDSIKLLKFTLSRILDEVENYEHFRKHGKHKEE